MPSCISIFSTPIFNYTSLGILNILLIFFQLLPSFSVPSRDSACALLYCAFTSLGHATIPQFHHSFFFPVPHSGHKIFSFSTLPPIVSFLPYSSHSTLVIPPPFASHSLHFHASSHSSHHVFLTLTLERNPCPLFSWVQTPLSSHPLYFTYVATTLSVIYPLSNMSTPLGGILPSLQYSCTFSLTKHTSLPYCYAFCGKATYTTLSSSYFSFPSFLLEYSLYWCPSSLYLKHCTTSLFSCLLTTSFLTPYYITLFNNTLNLFWGVEFSFFSF